MEVPLEGKITPPGTPPPTDWDIIGSKSDAGESPVPILALISHLPGMVYLCKTVCGKRPLEYCRRRVCAGFGGKSGFLESLIVDDTPANLWVLSGMLKEKGYKVRPVPNGVMALKTAEEDPPDIILLDIMMPDMDGYEVCRKLKENEKLKDIPVIFISALDETLDKIKAFSVGGVDYITKPFQWAEVEKSGLTTKLDREALSGSFCPSRVPPPLHRVCYRPLKNFKSLFIKSRREVSQILFGFERGIQNFLHQLESVA